MARRTQEEAARTRAGLVAAGRALFADPGFAATTLDDIARTCGVTRGACYHYFASKNALFEEVFLAVEAEITDRCAAAAGPKRTALARFRAGCEAFLDCCADPDVARIVLLDGPSVLGWERWRLLDGEHGFALVAQGVGASIRSGELSRHEVAPLAHLLLGALNHAGMTISRSSDPQSERVAVGAAFSRLLDGLAKNQSPNDPVAT